MGLRGLGFRVCGFGVLGFRALGIQGSVHGILRLWVWVFGANGGLMRPWAQGLDVGPLI